MCVCVCVCVGGGGLAKKSGPHFQASGQTISQSCCRLRLQGLLIMQWYAMPGGTPVLKERPSDSKVDE